MTDIINVLLPILVSLCCVTSKSCDVLEMMSCKCHSSYNGESEQLICHNNDQMTTIIKLTNATLQTTRSFDSFHLTFSDQNVKLSAMFINSLSHLFPRPSTSSNKGKSKPMIKITLSFPNFRQLHVEDYAFYQLFGARSDSITILTLELTSNGQITFSSMALSQLQVDQLIVHSSSLEPYSFEEIFNNTNIGELTMEGLTPRSNDTHKAYFTGKIQSAKFTKMVELVSNDEFPNYPVRAMTIEAHEARQINASTFIHYRNLHGFHLIRPKFFFDNKTFDGFQYLTNLETIELDAETLKDHTFQHASRIHSLILGQNIRYLSEHSLDHLDHLKHFDVSKITLDQLYPSARCILARSIEKQCKSNPLMIISPPQAEQCDCIYDFILAILKKKPDNYYRELCENNQQERCQLSECELVTHFRLPSSERQPINHQQEILPPVVETMIDLSMPLYPSQDQHTTIRRLPSYVHRRPSVYHRIPTDIANQSSHQDFQISQISALKVNKPIDPNSIPSDDYYDNSNSSPMESPSQTNTNTDDEEYRIAMKNETYKWISLSLVCITILCLLLVGTLIWFFTCRPMKRYNKEGFQPVLPVSSNV